MGVFIPLIRIMNLIQVALPTWDNYYITNEKDQVLVKMIPNSESMVGEISTLDGIEEFEVNEKDNYIFAVKPTNVNVKLYRAVPKTVISSGVPPMIKILRAATFIALIIVPLLWILIRKLVISPMHLLDTGIKELEKDNIEYRLPENRKITREFQFLYHSFNNMAKQIKKLRIQRYEIEIEKLQTETTNLRLQVNPHLLLNSLNMIYNLAKLEELERIQTYTLSLSEYFRYVLRKADEMVTLDSEMRFVKCYLDIQQIRFPGAFTSVYMMDEELADMEIPSLLIQTFVENSTKYALRLGSEIEIIIVIKREGDKAIISIIDTGNGIDEDTLKKLNTGVIIQNKTGKHIGIWNLRKRLHLYYGDEVDLSISSILGEGTQVWIKIPIGKEKNNELTYSG